MGVNPICVSLLLHDGVSALRLNDPIGLTMGSCQARSVLLLGRLSPLIFRVFLKTSIVNILSPTALLESDGLITARCRFMKNAYWDVCSR